MTAIPESHQAQAAAGVASPPARPRTGGLLAGMRIRKKLIVLHTAFSLVLAVILWVALQPAVRRVVERAEEHQAQQALSVLLASGVSAPIGERAEALISALGPDVTVRWGTAAQLGVPREVESSLRRAPAGGPVGFKDSHGRQAAAAYIPEAGVLVSVTARQTLARAAVVRLYILMTLALLAVYALVAAALEVFILPRHVYQPIRTILAADRAVEDGRRADEVVPDESMPADELGEIMRSRNRSIRALRRHEADLAAALRRIEEVATDLKRKNHLLETARQKMADADRLASLGIMSAGLAHELNTPLAVIKGLAEKLHADRSGDGGAGGGNGTRQLSAVEAALLVRVVGRLERLSESLLDFARVRPPQARSVTLRPLVDEAWTLVRLDREAASVTLDNRVPEAQTAWCDPDRMLQVLVNLIRNAVDAATSPRARPRSDQASAAPRIEVAAEESEREAEAGRQWVSLTIADNGPGIDPEMLPRLFQPFATTRLDSRGTGLGLATSEGIVREHGGMLLARNRTAAEGNGGGQTGAVFEVMLPVEGM